MHQLLDLIKSGEDIETVEPIFNLIKAQARKQITDYKKFLADDMINEEFSEEERQTLTELGALMETSLPLSLKAIDIMQRKATELIEEETK